MYNGLPKDLTVGALLRTACGCETATEAGQMLADYRAENPEHADQNLGYVFGYVEPRERRQRLYKLFDLKHPVFGGRP